MVTDSPPLLRQPSRQFGVERVTPGRDYRLGVDYEEAIALRDGHRYLVRVWYLNDEGFATDVFRSLFAAVRGPFERDAARVAIRLATPIPAAGSDSMNAARGLLDLFVMRYQDDLEAFGR